LALALLLSALALTVLLPRLLGWASGPDGELVAVLKSSERRALELRVPDAEPLLTSSEHHYDRITVSVEGQTQAVATATLDFTGNFGATKVSSLGYEQVPFRYQERDWRPVKGLAPTLVSVIALLERRRKAIEVGDRTQLSVLAAGSLSPDAGVLGQESVWEMTSRRYEARAWYLRVDREEIRVTEEYRLVGASPDRPVDQTGARSFRLVPGPDGNLRFAGGVL
jgi:hypothetical protein